MRVVAFIPDYSCVAVGTEMSVMEDAEEGLSKETSRCSLSVEQSHIMEALKVIRPSVSHEHEKYYTEVIGREGDIVCVFLNFNNLCFLVAN